MKVNNVNSKNNNSNKMSNNKKANNNNKKRTAPSLSSPPKFVCFNFSFFFYLPLGLQK